MAAPEGYNPLGKIGISYKGEYSSNTAYERLDAVAHNGSTYLAIKDAPYGAPRDDKINWMYLAKGFSSDVGESEIVFTEAEELEPPVSGEKIKSVFGKVSLAIKNIKTLITLLGKTDISSIGDGTVTGAISDVNGKLTVQDDTARLVPINGSLTYSQLRKYGKVVTISLRLTDCDIPYGTVICTLPEGYKPSTTWISILGQVYDGSSWISGSITIDLGGNIRQEITQNNIKMCIFSGAFITD